MVHRGHDPLRRNCLRGSGWSAQDIGQFPFVQRLLGGLAHRTEGRGSSGDEIGRRVVPDRTYQHRVSIFTGERQYDHRDAILAKPAQPLPDRIRQRVLLQPFRGLSVQPVPDQRVPLNQLQQSRILRYAQIEMGGAATGVGDMTGSAVCSRRVKAQVRGNI